MELLIKNVNIIDAAMNCYGDVYIKDGKIFEIGIEINKNCLVIDGKGHVLMPSFTDMHSHLREPGYEYKEDIESFSYAAVKGGYTAVNAMANTNPICSSMDIVNQVVEKGTQLGLVDIHQTVSITEGLKGESISHIKALDESVKFISDDGRGVQNSELMLKAMLAAKEKGITVISHAENEELTKIDTRLAENTMSWRDITLSKFTGCPLHLAHISTKEVVDYVIKEKKKQMKEKNNVKLTCEVTPHHLFYTDAVKYTVNPPLRSKEDVDALIFALANGYIDVIATDHAPHSSEDKLKGSPGISGIETAFAACYTRLVKEGHITINKLSELMSKNPSKLMGLNKGEIKIGLDGDVILVEINKKYQVNKESFKSKGKNTPFHGEELFGEILLTIKNGKVVYQNNREEF